MEANKCIAYYRLPYDDNYTRIVSAESPVILNSITDIGRMSGFVFVPFMIDESHPPILISADEVTTQPCPSSDVTEDKVCYMEEPVTDFYSNDFHLFHNAIQNREFEKLVLCRTKDVSHPEMAMDSLETLFFRTSQQYPRAMVMLVSSEVTGTWLIATPEILLECENGSCRTVALAGTMPYTEGYPKWSEKNQMEQQLVERYIDETIKPYSRNIIKDGPLTVRAGNIMHLCTTFRFRLQQGVNVGYLLQALHPTPAVCGLPKESAKSFIIENEHCNRSYYSGFAGPANMNGGTHLFVSLRCMQIHTTHSTLFAGGGIMPDSCLESEWKETQNKMLTMLKVL